MSKSFTRTGLHLDLRIQVMTMPALYQIAEQVAELGLNTLLMEWEGTFPFHRHPLIPNRFAYSNEEVDNFITHCKGLGIDVIPLQQCCGHIEYILQHDRYAHLRESQSDLCQLCPSNEENSIEIFADIFKEIAAAHPSSFIHIGGDETYLLGHCSTCSTKAEKHGKSSLYVDYFKHIAQVIVELGKRPILWADMLLKYPEATSGMPKECVFMDWNYGWSPNHFGDLESLRKTEFEFWGAPALRCSPDNHALTDWHTHFNNLRDFIPFGRSQGYTSMILTSWSTSGVYGYEWDKPGEPMRIQPMRRVYPLSGFRILMQTFAQATRSASPIDPETTVINYACERFQFNTSQSKHLWEALNADSTSIEGDTNIELLLKSACKAQRALAQLKPLRNPEEFAHFVMMADLRVFHLQFKQIEARLNAPSAHSGSVASAISELTLMLEESNDLNSRFDQLNSDFLQAGELADEAAYRTRKLRELLARLTRAGRYHQPDNYS